MPWPIAMSYLKQIAKDSQAKLVEISAATRAAQADEKGWKAWLKAMG